MTRFASIAILIVLSPALAAKEYHVVVSAGNVDRSATLVRTRLPEALWPKSLIVTRDDTRKTVVSQVVTTHIGWVVRDLRRGQSRKYTIREGKSKTPSVIQIDDRDRKTVKIRHRKKTLMIYREEIEEVPKGIDPVYQRSGYIHPIFTPKGIPVTDDFPPDHPHQHAVFFAWVNTTYKGRRVDFWNQKAQTGMIKNRFRSNPGNQGLTIWGEMRNELVHYALDKNTKAKEAVLQEWWELYTYRLRGYTVVDLESSQHCLGEALTVNKFHYGGFAIRGNRSWYGGSNKNKPPGDFLTSEGKHRKNGNHSRPDWVCLSGPTRQGHAGLVAMSHPDNFRHPQHVRLHPSKPYFCFAPMVEKGFSMKRGKPYVSRYRLLAFDGKPDKKRIAAAWRDYAEPVSVKWEVKQ